uniref:CSON002690 protein n=1 Tax=Culicoides sonorensis TaxID=179676 RepID=A0A336K7H5_CULSO
MYVGTPFMHLHTTIRYNTKVGKSIKLASTAISNLRTLGLAFKLQNSSPTTQIHPTTDYSEEDSCPSSPTESTSAMVETSSATSNIGPNSPPRAMSAETQNYLNTAMLLNTAQTCNYLGQRLSSLQNERVQMRQHGACSPSPPSPIMSTHHHQQQQHHQQQSPSGRTQAPTSLFTIDSILAPTSANNNKGSQSGISINNNNNNNNRSSESPGSTPPASANTSPIRPRLPMLHHPGLHLGHLAAAAASGFGSTSEFLGK